jgi:NitT/TauT family transport system ATP-binding protein
LGAGDEVKSLSIRNLSKTYFDAYAGSNVTAVQDVSFDVKEGEFVAVVGPSGCGKTTILNMIAGFIPHSGGEILLDGIPVKGPGPDRGVVFQSFALFPWKTVLDNVAFGPKMRGVAKEERERIAHEYLALAKLTEAAGRYPTELSGGMQQRVGVVRALANEPEVLLMDEPFAALDAQTRTLLHAQLQELWIQTHKTILFVTHSVGEAVRLADKIVILHSHPGRIRRTVDVALPHPRNFDSPDITELVRLVRKEIEDEVNRVNAEMAEDRWKPAPAGGVVDPAGDLGGGI